MLSILIMTILFTTSILILVTNKKRTAKTMTLLSLITTTIISCAMLVQVSSGSKQVFSWGNQPWNISIKICTIEALMSLLFTGIGFLVVWASITMIEQDVEEDKIPLYYALINILIGSLCAVVYFDNLLNIFVFVEISSFVSAGIVIIKNKRENYKAGLKYLTLSILASSLMLMGFISIYRSTGFLVMDDIKKSFVINFAENKTNLLYAIRFVTIGVAIKSALFPFHIWLPDAHGSAPSASSAILSGLVVKSYIILLIKILYITYGAEIVNQLNILPILLLLGVIGMIYGSLLAMMQEDLKKMLAYSSVAQIGYIFMGIGLGNVAGLMASLFHIINHAITKTCLFLVAGCVISQTKNQKLRKMKGIGIEMPVTMSLFTICALSMIGIPPTLGFNSKWNFAQAITHSKHLWVVIILSLSSLLNALYYLPVVIKAFFNEKIAEKNVNIGANERPIVEMLPIIILCALVIVFGANYNSLYNLLTTAFSNL